MPKKRHHNIPASYLVLFDGNKTLLSLRKNTGYEDGNYSLVAGHVDPGETFTDCVIREVREESGIELKRKDLKVAHVMHRAATDENYERVDVFFVARKWSGKIINLEPEKCAEIAWFDIDNLPKKTIPYVAQAIRSILDGEFYSEYGWE